MKTTNEIKHCDFCNGLALFVYKMDNYNVFQCQKCGTGFVNPMPEPKVLEQLYNGFIQKLNADAYPKYRTAAEGMYELLGLPVRKERKMLDIGGGGGFFCKAFEDLSYGKGTYVDLDPKSCQFAKELGITNVFNCDAMNLEKHVTKKFDFIYCRHLIEHLVSPTDFLKKIFSLLNDGGIFVVQCPNGDSLEYLPYTHLNIKYRFNKIKLLNDFSSLKTLRLMLGGLMLHGMDPPRHLWAISRKGMGLWADKNQISCQLFTRNLGDKIFSPGYRKKSHFRGKVKDFIGFKILTPLRGGTHLIAVFSKG